MGIFDIFRRKARTIQSLPLPKVATVDANYLRDLEEAVLGDNRRAGVFSLANAAAERSSFAQVLAHRVARDGASVKMILEVATGDGGWTTVTETTSRPRRLLDRPNRKQSWAVFVRAALGIYQTCGRVYVFAHRNKLGEVSDLVLERGGNVTEEVSALDGETIYTVQRGVKKRVYKVEDTIIWSYPDLFDHREWTSPWKISVNSRTADSEAEQWQRESMAVRVVPDIIVQLDRGVTQAQAAPIVEGMRRRKKAGEGRQSLVVDHNIAVHNLNPASVEVDFVASRSSFQEQLSATFGVPRPILGILENATLANVEASELIFWNGTVLPYLKEFVSEIEEFLSREFNARYRITPDINSVPALRAAAKEAAGPAAQYHAVGVPFDVINDRLGLGFPVFEGSDTSFLNSGLVPAEMVTGGGSFGFGLGEGTLGPLPAAGIFEVEEEEDDSV